MSCQDRSTSSSQPPKRPNVIFILADDLGVYDLSYTGSNFYETPNIDAIAESGAVFTNGYAAAQVCSPSRASIMLGQFTARHGITDWIGAASGEDWREKKRNNKLLPAAYVRAIPKSNITLAEAMKVIGYKTFFAGKWHLGDKGSYPEDHGFEINKGGWEVGSPKGGYYAPWKNPYLSNQISGENLSMRLAKETSNFIRKNKDQPFFAFLSFYAVHGPIQTTKEKWRKYRDKADSIGLVKNGYEMERVLPIRTVQDNPIYAGLVESMDDAVGYVLGNLKAMGLDENTIVIFTSDNGGVASGDAFSTTNLPLRGGKGYQWEGGIREPYFIKVPWLNHNGLKIDYPATGSDFFPTILDLIGAEKLPNQHVDGLSLKPLLEGNTLVERPLYWHYPHYGNQGGEPVSIVREGDWKFIHYWEDGHGELYNLTTDAGEQKDVSLEYSNISSKLLQKLMAFLENVDAKFPKPDLEFDDELAAKMHQQKIEVLLPTLETERKEFLAPNFSPNEDWWGSEITKD
ncbi:sulfatase [Spongiivirga citrea]|uniref:Sulfatase-like hydrolase/transferase n=1 Tax=Spongiivirga citrea TaxID=1481457 RepID=A0A6M0CJ67_9FLAO|nr:sulfatase [Spongiivirga citrea]NER17871.1 sulfatase-like hydrolase/transferase [Spongiivirga citrea]